VPHASLGRVVGLWRYPVKSMGGERLERAPLSWRGIPGDRGWAVHDETRGGVTGAKRLPPLRACRARYPDPPAPGAASPPAEIEFPDGTRVMTDSAAALPKLAALLGRPVALRALGPAGSESARRLTSEGETPETVRALAGLVAGEPMADLSEFPPERLRELRRDNFFDAFPIHLITRTTLRTLARIAPDSVWDERRFRPNLLIEAEEAEGYPEQAWIGRRLCLGGAAIEVVAGCPRCVMVTQPVDEVPQDQRVLRTLVRETKHTAGVYARVVEEGEVRVGDGIG
jgi:uncharacterized protein YcbX